MSGSGPPATEGVDDGARVSLHARPSTGWSAPSPIPGSSAAGAARPTVWIGAPAAGGLMLPAADPTPGHLYAPRGVWLDDRRLIVADTGNHRVLIWHDATALASHGPADVVLGQPDFTTEGAQAGGRGPERGMRLPTGVVVHAGRLIVADAWNHRLLVWDEVPTASDIPPDAVVGQPDPSATDENRGAGCSPIGFYWPFGVAVIGDRCWVADTGNRRVLGWDGVPAPDEPPAVVLGQDDGYARDENRGELGPASFRWPHDIAGTAHGLFVADAGNHRLLAWDPVPDGDRGADHVFGQPDFTTATEFPYQAQSATALRFPYAIDIADRGGGDRGGDRGGGGDGAAMVVADTANNRVLVWDAVPRTGAVAADRVLGQPDFGANGENRWEAVGDDTFCWPYGLSLHAGRVAVADSGNNRVMIWELG